MARYTIAAATALLAFVPIAASAQPSSPTSPATSLRPPAVMRVPTTFSASETAIANAQTPAERYRAQLLVRSERAAQERAFVQKFGYGTPVKLRERRY